MYKLIGNFRLGLIEAPNVASRIRSRATVSLYVDNIEQPRQLVFYWRVMHPKSNWTDLSGDSAFNYIRAHVYELPDKWLWKQLASLYYSYNSQVSDGDIWGNNNRVWHPTGSEKHMLQRLKDEAYKRGEIDDYSYRNN